MKFKNYFDNLEKYWSANFLALLSSTFLLSFIAWILTNLVDLSFQATNFSEYWELIDSTCPYHPFYIVIFFPISCILSACISIFYIFIIISRKIWYIFVSIFLILIFLSTSVLYIYGNFSSLIPSGILIAFFFLPMTIIGILISITIYLILLLLELFPKFRILQSLVSQNSTFKKYIRIFYWSYFIMICIVIYATIYLISLH